MSGLGRLCGNGQPWVLCQARSGLGEAAIAFASCQLERHLVPPWGEAPGFFCLGLGEPKILVEVMLQDWSQRRAQSQGKGLP